MNPDAPPRPPSAVLLEKRSSTAPRRPPTRRWRTRSAPARNERGSTSAIELMALTPMCALMVLLIVWAGNSAHAELATSLAAQEAAIAAAACCNTDPAAPGGPPGGDQKPDEPTDETRTTADTQDDVPAFNADTARQLTAEAVITSRPSLAQHCLGGPQPADPAKRWASHAAADTPSGDTVIHVITVHITCETDGTAAPMRGLFPTRTVHGHGTHIAATQTPATPKTDSPEAAS